MYTKNEEMHKQLFDVLLKRDPVDEDVPYCTLKSFPAVMDHCIEWARDKVYHRSVYSTNTCSNMLNILYILIVCVLLQQSLL